MCLQELQLLELNIDENMFLQGGTLHPVQHKFQSNTNYSRIHYRIVSHRAAGGLGENSPPGSELDRKVTRHTR